MTLSLPFEKLESQIAGRPAHWISEPNVWALHGERLKFYGAPPTPLLVPSGEDAKTPDILEKLLDTLIQQGLRRYHLIVAVGGGALLDLAGLAAGLALRGVSHLFIPTTLVGQIDAAWGGKTAINLSAGKNLYGMYHNPEAVVIDKAFLQTLPPQEILNGLGEILKTALLAGGSLWEKVRNCHLADLPLEELATYKMSIVNQDPQEKGLRAVLNLGHTAGHGWESLGMGGHGLCVAWGIRLALRLGEQRDLTDPALLKEVDAWLTRHGLPLHPPLHDARALLQKMAVDKKARDSLRWILLKSPGEPLVVDTITEQDIFQAISAATNK